MRLKVLLPTEVLIDAAVTKVTAEAENGSFCLLPRHIDFVAALVPGLLSFVSTEGREEFLAVDEGILVKCGPQVMVSTRNAVIGPDLGTLRHMVEDQFRILDERERMARSAVVKLEADFVRRFIEMEKQ
ncbi:MAG TPA: F0F1 ATP synthase subunit epsilon [Spirillospora sp.]|nr:F0F1 ATP synthase subunit epsilon [Spirillospora sp.]